MYLHYSKQPVAKANLALLRVHLISAKGTSKGHLRSLGSILVEWADQHIINFSVAKVDCALLGEHMTIARDACTCHPRSNTPIFVAID